MNRNFIFFALLLFSIANLSSWKPALPVQASRINAIPYENLDFTLRARPFTRVDELNELTEDRRLTQSQQDSLTKLNKEQDIIVAETKKVYLAAIKLLKKEKFNKTGYIHQTITDYRETVKITIHTKLQRDIVALLKELGYEEPKTQNTDRRRQREQ